MLVLPQNNDTDRYLISAFHFSFAQHFSICILAHNSSPKHSKNLIISTSKSRISSGILGWFLYFILRMRNLVLEASNMAGLDLARDDNIDFDETF